MKVLVTGGTGFLGKSVVRALVASSHTVRLLVRETSNLVGLEGMDRAVGDVTDQGSLARAALGCDAIVHTAALVKVWVRDETAFDRVNVGGLRNVLAVAASSGTRVVYTSSFIALGPSRGVPRDEVDGHPGPPYRNAYERTKAEADRVARDAARSGQDVVTLYPGVVYGPGDLTEGNIVVRMLLDHLAGRLPGLIGGGTRLWSYAFVEDVARGHVLALERGRPGQGYLLAGENAALKQTFALAAPLLGKEPPRLSIPYPVATSLGWLCWAWAELTGLPPLLTHEVVGVFREDWAYTSAKAEGELGYRVRSLQEGLEATAAWLRSTGRA
jgi:farnesol dehydrogenase